MELEIWRYSSDDRSTLGLFMLKGPRPTWEQLGYTCEDEYREIKVPGHTRILAGRYPVTLRTGSPVGEIYRDLFPDFYQGLLWIRDVPNFEFCYLECGNREDQTEGCVLIGLDRIEMKRQVTDSRLLYAKVYPMIARAIKNEGCWLTIRDLDRAVLPTP